MKFALLFRHFLGPADYRRDRKVPKARSRDDSLTPGSLPYRNPENRFERFGLSSVTKKSIDPQTADKIARGISALNAGQARIAHSLFVVVYEEGYDEAKAYGLSYYA